MSKTSSPWFTNLKPNREARLRLFCFPYVGGAATLFRQWPQSLPSTVQVSAVQLPGRGPRTREAPFTRLSALVEQVALAIEPHLDRPFAFFGYSLGAIIAFELARRLRQQAQLEPLRLFVAACRAPQMPETSEPIYNLPETELLERLRRLNGTPKEVLDHSELIQLMLPLLRADFEMAETYAYSAAPPLRSPISAFGGLHDLEVKREHLEAWRDQTTGGFNIRMFEGDHFFIHQSEPLLLDIIARELQQS